MRISKTFMSIFFSAALLGVVGCKSKKEGDKKEGDTKTETVTSDTGGPSKLEGAWEIKRVDGELADVNIGTVYEFKGSKLSFGKDGFTNPGTTVVTDSTFSFVADGSSLSFLYNYKFEGDTLVVKMDKGIQVFRLVKK